MADEIESVQSNASTTTFRESLELEKIRLERTKLALDVRLQRRELAARHARSWLSAISNPLTLAIVGGSLTLFTSVVTNYLTANATREADERRASQARDAGSAALQSDLIKEFLKTSDAKTARDNLTFLIDAGLIPDHEKRIKKYLANDEKAVPKLGDGATSRTSYPACTPASSVRPSDALQPLGVSIHVATNRVDPNAYGGMEYKLLNAVLDANSMQQLASRLGYRTSVLLDSFARSDCLSGAIAAAAQQLRAGDTFMLTISGIGSQTPDATGAEPDKYTETLALYDRFVSANELYEWLSKFAPGVTLIVVEDTSHAASLRPPRGAPARPGVMWVLAGAKENQLAYDSVDNSRNGAFTAALLSVWNDGAFRGSYGDLIAATQKKMSPMQTPQLYVYGASADDASRRPFNLGHQADP
jgi:caspase domain-containing protein